MQWQAQLQNAVPAATAKKGGSKAGATAKSSKADAAEQCKAWYQEVTSAAKQSCTDSAQV